MERARIGLVGCVKSKRAVPAQAADLYTSPLFVGRRRWVEAGCSRWYILSAKHGLVAPGLVLDPYDETLTTQGSRARRAWSERVMAQLHEALVIADMGIRAERAWALPYELRSRLGYLSPDKLAADPQAVRAAVQQAPKLHRFVNVVPDWLVEAARIVVDQFDGDAERLWSDKPTAVELRQRLERFPGIGQKKAAMAVEILARDLGKSLSELAGSDVAYDVHLRRVFLRTGLADHDAVDHMVAVARALNPDRPGALDLPAWDIGRRWCRPSDPDCPACPLNAVCPRLIERGSRVRGV